MIDNPKTQHDAQLATRNVLSTRARILGKRLLEQQCWCWGHDVRHAGGNLLLRYGFERQRPPHEINGATMYVLRLLPDCFIALWGFGLWYGERGRGAVFVNRFQFDAKYFHCAELNVAVWEGAQIERLHRENSLAEAQYASASTCRGSQAHSSSALLHRAVRWIGDYETWLLAQSGLEYRQRCLEAWSQKFVPPEAMVPSWQRLSRLIERRQRKFLLH